MSLAACGLVGAAGGPFDLAIGRGEPVAITGPSGAGKSVLLRMIADLDPHEGTVSLDGTDCTAMSGPEWRRRVAYLAAEPGWWHDETAAHFSDRAAAEAMMPELGLALSLLDQPVHRLSTGERLRLALIRTLLNRPDVLLLDEPTGPLDPEATKRVDTLLRGRLADGVILAIVTHDDALAARLGARGLHLDGGRLTPR